MNKNNKDIQVQIMQGNKIVKDCNDEQNTNYSVMEIEKPIREYIKKLFKEEFEKEIKEHLNTEIKEANNIMDSITYNHIDFDRYSIRTELEDIFNKYNLNKSQIANMIGINRATLNNIIKDPNSCSLVNAYKLSMTFGITIEDLFKYVLIK